MKAFTLEDKAKRGEINIDIRYQHEIDVLIFSLGFTNWYRWITRLSVVHAQQSILISGWRLMALKSGETIQFICFWKVTASNKNQHNFQIKYFWSHSLFTLYNSNSALKLLNFQVPDYWRSTFILKRKKIENSTC